MVNLNILLVYVLYLVLAFSDSHATIRLDHQFGNAKSKSMDLDEKAFLGDLDQDELEKMDSKESKERLGVIFDKIDSNEDKIISEKELANWITFTLNRYMHENTNALFEEYDLNEDKLISWPEYEEASQKLGSVTIEGENEYIDLSKGTEKDQRKFVAADTNLDGYCSKEEFQGFVHPELLEHMKQFMVKETLLEMDTNKNGFVEKEEYVNSVFGPEEVSKHTDWAEKERQNFADFLDKNRDGKLDSEEILLWVAPESSEQAIEEAKHLIPIVDNNEDGFVSKDEMLQHLESFSSSQVTDFGELLRRHDEL